MAGNILHAAQMKGCIFPLTQKLVGTGSFASPLFLSTLLLLALHHHAATVLIRLQCLSNLSVDTLWAVGTRPLGNW
jgi:hypothetical protein